jgi:hypothetical protein
MQRLVAGLDALTAGSRVILGGDFNTAAMPKDQEAVAALLTAPEACEPLFGVARRAGYVWTEANDAAPTQRTRPDGSPPPPFRRIDWLFAYGVRVTDPRTVPAVDSAGSAISDHELIVATMNTEAP